MTISQPWYAVETDGREPQIELVAPETGISSSARQWLSFALQLAAVAALQAGDDIVRGNLDPPNMIEAMQHARMVAAIEQAHGIFIEPGVQLWVRHVHALFGILSYSTIGRGIDVVYALGQTLVPLAVAIWIFLRHRPHFPLLRNVALLSSFLALVGYELYPTAPPRLTSNLMYGHHIFRFQDTAQHVIGDGKLNGVPIGYNAYSAIPSLHIAWALLVATSVLLLARRPMVRLIAALYPLLMLFTVVASGNHFLVDAGAGALADVLALVAALTVARYRRPGAIRWIGVAIPPQRRQSATMRRRVEGGALRG
jgi:hypothetical protein